MELTTSYTLLNASIEAARAGEAGKGFTVVADEMNHMSTETRKGMVTIHDILQEIRESCDHFNKSIQKCQTAFDQSKETFGSVTESLRSINEQAFEIHGRVQAIADKTGTIADNSGELIIRQISFITYQQITNTTHEIARHLRKQQQNLLDW